MPGDRSRLNGIKTKWTAERKINASDVTWLLGQADEAETMRAADSLRRPRPQGSAVRRTVRWWPAMTPRRNLDIVLDALERGETPCVVIVPDPRDAAAHPGKPGTNGRYNGNGRDGCRCTACRAAHNAYNLARKHARRAS